MFADSRCNLPQARVEAARIGELLGSEPLLGDRVTRENLIREVTGADIIHIKKKNQSSTRSRASFLATVGPSRRSTILARRALQSMLFT